MTKKYPLGEFLFVASFEGDGDNGLAVLFERLVEEFLAMPFPESDIKPIMGMSVAVAGKPLRGRDYAYTKKRLYATDWENLEGLTISQYGFPGPPSEGYDFAWQIDVTPRRGLSEVKVLAKRFVGVDDDVIARAIENWCEALAAYRPLIVAKLGSFGQDEIEGFYTVDKAVDLRVLVRDGKYLEEEPWPSPPKGRRDTVEHVTKKYPMGAFRLVVRFSGIGDDGLASLVGQLADKFLGMPFPKVEPRAAGMYVQAARTPISARDYDYTKERLHATNWENLAALDVYQYGFSGPPGEGYSFAWQISVETRKSKKVSDVSVLAKRFVGVEDDVIVRAIEGWCEVLAAYRWLIVAELVTFGPGAQYYQMDEAADVRVLARRGKYLGEKS
jgi:hypothetical protein